MADGKKMAKREKNFHTLNDLEKEISNAGETFRYLALQTNYRTRMNFTVNSLKAAGTAFEKLNEKKSAGAKGKKKNEDDFISALNDDLNTAKALSAFQKSPSKKKADALGIKLKKTKSSEIPAKILKLAEKRDQLRANEQFIKADALRKQIEGLGYKVEDGEHKSKITPARH
jgi:cysteinyl-tRNA synthetase